MVAPHENKMKRSVILDKVRFSYNHVRGGDKPLFEDFSLTLDSGGIIVVLGASGSGKSTLLSLIAGVLFPHHGSIQYYGFGGRQTRPLIGLVFQSPALIPWRTVLSNVLFGLELRSNVDDNAIDEARMLLRKSDLAEYENRYPRELSGGMQQRVSIVRSIVSGASVLLLDEPFSNSDFLTRRALQRETSNLILHREMLVVLVTHDLNDALRLGDRIVVIGDRPVRVLESFEIDIPRQTRMYGTESISAELRPHLERVWRNWEREGKDNK